MTVCGYAALGGRSLAPPSHRQLGRWFKFYNSQNPSGSWIYKAFIITKVSIVGTKRMLKNNNHNVMRGAFKGGVLVRLFFVCAVVPIFITFWGVTEFQDTYHGFYTFYLFLVFLCGFFILLVREKHRKTLYRFLLQK